MTTGEVSIILSRLVLGGVFCVAGFTKLRDLASFRGSLKNFGVPKSFVAPVAAFLPWIELMIGVLLLTASAVHWVALVAAVLLGLFTAAIALNLANGRRPDCRCFGELSSTPIGSGTLVRNACFGTLAVYVAWGGDAYGQDSALALITTLGRHSWIQTSVLGVLTVAVGIFAWVSFHLLQQHGRILIRLNDMEMALEGVGINLPSRAPRTLEKYPLGSTPPIFTLPDLDKRPVSLSSLIGQERDVLLVFSDVACGPCNHLIPSVAKWQETHGKALGFLVISRGSLEDNRQKYSPLQLLVLVQSDREVADEFGADMTPSAILIGRDGKVASPMAIGAQAIENLVARVTGAQHTIPHQPIRPGGNVPRLGDVWLPTHVTDKLGVPLAIPWAQNGRTLLIFWDFACHFCQEMLPSLRDAVRKNLATQVVLVSRNATSGDAPDLECLAGVGSEELFRSGAGMHGTPSAIVIDAAGKVASAPAIGARSVLALFDPDTRAEARRGEEVPLAT